jgi:hypothetical protein
MNKRRGVLARTDKQPVTLNDPQPNMDQHSGMIGKP